MTPLRRTTRLTENEFKDASESGLTAQLEADVPSDEQKLAQGKKRKAPTSAPQTTKRAPKKVKQSDVKMLSQLERLSYDAKFEIFSYLNPLDLLHLSSTSKDFREILVTQSTGSLIWKSARSNVIPSMPDCPGDLNEAQFAELAFCEHCHFCNGTMREVNYSWSAHKRICDKCVAIHCEAAPIVQFELYPVPGNDMSSVFPWVRIDTIETINHRFSAYVFVSRLALWTQGYNDLETSEEEKNEWLQNKLSAQRDINAHAVICDGWFEEYKVHQESERKRIIKERAEELGWAEELARMCPYDLTFPQVGRTKYVLKQKWWMLDSRINIYMEEIKERRLQNERYRLLEVRLPILEEAMQAQLAKTDEFTAHSLYPMASELYLEPPIQDIILNTTKDVPFTKELLLPALSSIYPAVTKRMHDRVQDQLYRRMRLKNFPRGVSDRAKIFDLATTVFICCSDRCVSGAASDNATRVYWYQDIVKHMCSRGFEFPHHIKDGNALRQILKEGYRSHEYGLNISSVLTRFIMILIELCGLDPLTTTKKKMDDLDPIFECVTCHNVEKGRPTMTWKAMLRHYREVHNETRIEPKDLDIFLLPQSEAKEARKRIAEIELRNLRTSNPKLRYSPMSCVHCEGPLRNRQGYTWYNLTSHMAEVHGIDPMTDADVVVDSDATQPIPIYYMWPPRLIHGHNRQVVKVKDDRTCSFFFLF